MPLTYAEAIPKEDINLLKSNLSELTKKYRALAVEKIGMSEQLKQTADNLKVSDQRRGELEETINALQGDLNDLAKEAEVCNEELLRKPLTT